MESEAIYLAHRELIERAIGSICRRYRLSGADADDFASLVRLHLIEDDYAVLRRFEGRSSLQTYLTVVITHRFQDYRNARWGKWRPSAQARRLGPLAVQLETLLVRDGLTFDEAHETLRTNDGVTESRDALEAMAARFPSRVKRTFVSDSALELHSAPDSRADARAEEQEAAVAARRLSSALDAALARLSSQDRLILRMRFEDDLAVADIARVCGLEQKPLYRRMERLLAELRAGLEAGGHTASATADVLDARGFDLTAARGDDDGESHPDVRPFQRGGRTPVQNVRAE